MRALASLALVAASLAFAPLARAQTTLEVLPREVAVRPGDALRFTALLHVGPPGRDRVLGPPKVTWSTSAGSIDDDGQLVVPLAGDGSLEVTARVGGLEATARVLVQVPTLRVYPAEARIGAGHSLRFTVIDASGGGAFTPREVRWSALRGAVGPDGRYQAPQDKGVDTVTALVEGRAARVQVIIVDGAGEEPTPAPSPPAEPDAPHLPWRITTWRLSGNRFSAGAEVAVEVLAPAAATVKLFGLEVTGTKTVYASRTVHAGESVSLSARLSTSTRALELVLYGENGEVLAREQRAR